MTAYSGLLEILEQRVRGGLVHRVRIEDHVHAVRRLEWPHVQVAAESANLVDQNLVPHRLQLVESGCVLRATRPTSPITAPANAVAARRLPTPGGPWNR
jgi:hypothetical protein